jgi:hypothetical protein
MENLESKILNSEIRMKNPEQRFDTDYIFISDLHAPIHSKKSVKILTSVMNDIKPNNVIFGGDEVDAYYLSKYDTSVKHKSFQEEIDIFVNEIFAPLYEVNPKANYMFVASNHSTARLKKFMDESPAFHGMRMLTYQNMIEESMKTYMKHQPKIEVVQEVVVKYKKDPIYIFKHGNKVTKASAKAELGLEGISGMSGHKHTANTHLYNNRQGVIQWDTVGHLSDVSAQGYMKALSNGHPDWTQGFGYVQQFGNLMIPQNVIIYKKNKSTKECVVNGKVYTNKDKIYVPKTRKVLR